MKIGEILIHQKSISKEQLEIALWVQKRWGGLLGRILCSRGYINESDLTAALSSQLGFPAVSLADRGIPSGLSMRLPVEVCVSHLFMPFGQDPDSGVIQVAMMDPRDAVAIAALRSFLPQPFRLFLCGYLDLTEALFRAAHDQEYLQPAIRRASQEIIDADALVEELVIPQRPMRSASTARMELSSGYEVLEESEMLEAMAAQGRPARRSGEHDLVVDSGDFEILSDEEVPVADGGAPPAGTLPNADLQEPTDDVAFEVADEPLAAKDAGPGAADAPPVKDDLKAGAQHSGKDENKSSEKPEARIDPKTETKTGDPVKDVPAGRTGESAGVAKEGTAPLPEAGKKPPEIGSARRGLMSALGGGTREAEKKPPPSPFDSRKKK